jgi:hypothetical protein
MGALPPRTWESVNRAVFRVTVDAHGFEDRGGCRWKVDVSGARSDLLLRVLARDAGVLKYETVKGRHNQHHRVHASAFGT